MAPKKSKKKWRYLKLADGQKAKVDYEDYEKLSKYVWRVSKSWKDRRKLNAVTSIITKKGGSSLAIGRFLLNPPKGKFVYPGRENGNLDFRKENFIVCTVLQNLRMRSKTAGVWTSKYKGVSYLKKRGTWIARIKFNDKQWHLGSYRTEVEAARAYNKAVKRYFGKYGYLNPV